MRFWLASPLFRIFLRRFVLLWVAGKIANAGTAAHLGLAALAFRPASEIVACAAELVVLWAFIRRANEDVLLGNLGVDAPVAFAPLLALHCALSAALALAS